MGDDQSTERPVLMATGFPEWSPPPPYQARCSRHGTYYSGYSEHEANKSCPACESEAAARRRARERALAEAKRVKTKMQQMLKSGELYQRQDNQQLFQKNEAEAAKRSQMRAHLFSATTDKIMEEAKKFERLETNDPLSSCRKLNALNTIAEIRDKVLQYSYMGEIVKDQASAIAADLESSLGSDYDVIETEMARYEQYGKEMSEMTDAFVREFSKVLPNADDVEQKISDLAEIHKETLSNDEEEKKDAKDDIEEILGGIEKAIKGLEARLLLMDHYLSRMMKDYQCLNDFCQKKSKEFDVIVSSLNDFANEVEAMGDRSVFYGTDEVQETEFTEHYQWEEVKESYETVKVSSGSNGGSGFWESVATGAAAGGTVGAIGAGVEGFVGGAIIGGAIGALSWLFGSSKKRSSKPQTKQVLKTEKTTKSDKVTETLEEMKYDSTKQAAAIRNIAQKIMVSDAYKKAKKGLENENGKKQLEECERLQSSIVSLKQKIGYYRRDVNGIRDLMAKTEAISDRQTRQIGRQMKKLLQNIGETVADMGKKK